MAKREDFSHGLNADAEKAGDQGSEARSNTAPDTDVSVGIQLAQATGGQTGGQGFDPANLIIIATYNVTADGTRIEFPPGTPLGQLQFVIFGDDLYILTGDGKAILVKGGAVNFPTLVLTPGIEISSVELETALKDAVEGVPTAGPGEGTPQSSGLTDLRDMGNFGPDDPFIDLLPLTERVFSVEFDENL